MTINENELADARVAWGDGMIAISKAYEKSGIDDATIVANEMLDQLYGFEFGPVLFKPTLSGGSQTFRSNKESALAYFIGNNPKYPLDSGFGIKSWREVKSETSSTFVEDNIAMWMGWVTLIDKKGAQVKVDKSWGYKKTKNGSLKIVLHHSSLPYEV